ncbi:uncharacterized protein LOC121381344 isoform X2 [Gigantopelta aegis]|uniref:uncharacterized protein LOC121381344 isoform X2 n=1 Tax=Gigantopelta aegis TaxID=1735272 RepID=UPI001B88BEC3|nr:uncharacterized protein LOC121381344 isoform X2 [Gigantopelta aegis]
MEIMAEPSGSPIIILSEDDDDDDDDVVVVKEEKISIEDDDDVVFISRTPATTTIQSQSQLSTPSQPSAKIELPLLPTEEESFYQQAASVSSSSGVGIKCSDSISTVLRQTLRLSSLDHCPLDLSNYCSHIGSCKPDDPSLLSLKVQSDDSAVEVLASVSAETESTSMVCKEMDAAGASPVVNVRVAGSSDICGTYLGDSTLSSDVVTDACPASPGVSCVASNKTVSVKSSDFKSLVQSTKSGLLGGSMDSLFSIPSCLDSNGNTSGYCKTNGSGVGKKGETSCQDKQSSFSMKDACDLLLNFSKCSNGVSNSTSTVSNLSTNCDVTTISSVSVDSSGPTSLNSFFFPKSASNLINNNTDLISTLQSQNKPTATTVQCQVSDSVQNLCSLHQKDGLSRSLSLPVQTAATDSTSDADPSKSSTAAQLPALSTVNVSTSVSVSRIAQCNLPPRKRVRVRVEGEDGYVKVARPEAKPIEVCVLCKLTLIDLKVSRCTQGHPACGVCLEEQVKLILTDKQGSLECIKDRCSSYYPMSELKHALPSLVVDILEDKLHKDYINFISDMMLTNAAPPSSSDGSIHNNLAVPDHSSLGLVSSTSAMSTTNNNNDSNTDQSLSENNLTDLLDIADNLPPPEQKPDPSKNNDLPPHWYPMDKKMNLLIVELQPESEEYVDIAIQFYKTMTFPTVADIVKICRVQNPILWKYYCLKKMEMIHENDCHEIDMRSLFHGTTSSVIEAICRKGFDWRVCGKHGCVYGQGCYFARAAAYSHQYTDKTKSICRSRLASIRSMMFQAKQSSFLSNQLILPKPSPSLIGPFAPTVPPPAHMQFPSQNASSSSSSQLFSSQNLNFGRSMYGSLFTSSPSMMNNNNQSRNSPTPSTSSGYVSALVAFGTSQNSLNQPSKNVFLNSPRYSSTGSNSQSCSPFTSNTESGPNQSPFGSSSTTPHTSLHHQSLSGQGDEKSKGERIVSLSKIVSAPTRKIFLANVLVGKYTGGNSSLRKPPPFYSMEPYGKCYDSCVDDIFDPKIVVIFDSNQAYPEYIVEYNYSGDS